MHRKASWGSKREAAPPQNKCGHACIGHCGGIHRSKKLQMHLGEDPWTSQVWRKKHDDWPKVNEHLEGLSYINDLRHLCNTSNNKLCACYSFCLLETFLLSKSRKGQGHFAFKVSSPWQSRTLGFHPGYIPGQGTKISSELLTVLPPRSTLFSQSQTLAYDTEHHPQKFPDLWEFHLRHSAIRYTTSWMSSLLTESPSFQQYHL